MAEEADDLEPGTMGRLKDGKFRLMYVGGGRWINQYGSTQPVTKDQLVLLVVSEPEGDQQ